MDGRAQLRGWHPDVLCALLAAVVNPHVLSADGQFIIALCRLKHLAVVKRILEWNEDILAHQLVWSCELHALQSGKREQAVGEGSENNSIKQ